MEPRSVFSFRIWLNGDEAGFEIGWVWVALFGALLLWSCS